VTSPFQYPQAKHLRVLKPRPFARYQQFKPALRTEFEKKCVYCRTPDSVRGYAGFGVDHYRPKHAFPQLQTTYSNLFYCCNQCNSRKGGYWAEQAQERVPNPCDDEMQRHVRFVRAEVQARSHRGTVMLDLLDLNDPDVVQLRKAVEQTLVLCNRTVRQIQATLASLEQLADSEERAAAVMKLQEEKTKLLATIEFWMGR
jgi:uncharacterized protein (TIGR02646 family)